MKPKINKTKRTTHLLPDLLEAVDDGHGGDGVDLGEGLEAHLGEVVFARNLAKVDDGLRRGVHAQHAVVAGGVLRLVVVVAGDELVVVLAPREDLGPVGQVVRDDRQSVTPCLHNSLEKEHATIKTRIQPIFHHLTVPDAN